MGLKSISACFVLITCLSGCAYLQHTAQGYYGPKTGPMARMRFMNVGHDPQVFTSACPDYAALPAGHVNSFGHGKHDIGMPTLSSEKGAGYVEATIRAGQAVTVQYVEQTSADLAQNIETSNMINSGRYDVHTMPGQSCSSPITTRTFIARAGADYEARYASYGSCPRVEIFKIDTDSYPTRLEPVHYMPTRSCDAEDQGDPDDQ